MDTPPVHATSSSQNAPDSSISVPVSPKTNAPPRHRAPNQPHSSEHEGRQRGRSPRSIHTLCVDFMSKIHVKERFGTDSAQWIETNSALSNFKKGDLSKRGAHNVMTQVLGDNTELQQGLFDILNHNDADWDPSDWSRPIVAPNPSQAISPAFLETVQTENKPQVDQLPSLSQVLEGQRSPSHILVNPSKPYFPSMQTNLPSAYYDDQDMSSRNPPASGNRPTYSHYEEQLSPTNPGTQTTWSPRSLSRNNNSYPVSSAPDPNSTWQHYPPSPWHHYPSSLMSGNARHDPRLDPSLPASNNSIHESRSRLAGRHPQMSYEQNRYDQRWSLGSAGDPRWQYGQEQTSFGSHVPHYIPYLADHTISQSYPDGLSSNTLATEIPASHFSTAQGMSPSNGLGNDAQVRYMGTAQNEYNQEPGASNRAQDSQYPVGQASQLPNQSNVNMPRAPSKPRSGHYVHAICGKSFPTRSAVKKHHWGPKSGDLNTTRGCWFKHNRPAVAWDAHESCKAQPTTNTRQSTADSVPSNTDPKVPFTPPMVPGHSKAIHKQSPFQNTDTLVPVASYAKELEVRQPQDDRSDSVVAHLDAQAVAAEQNARQVPPWMTASGYGSTVTGNNFHSQMHSHTASSDTVQEQRNHASQNFTVAPQNRERSGLGSMGMTGGKDTGVDAQDQETASACPEQDVSRKRQRASDGEVTPPQDEQTQEPSFPDLKKPRI